MQKRLRPGTIVLEKKTGVVVVAADGSQRIRVETTTYYCQYRDGNGIHRESPTGCRDKQVALSKLSELERNAIRVREGVLTVADYNVAGHSQSPILEHFKDFEQSLQAAGGSVRHVVDTLRLAKTITGDCGFLSLRDINAEAVERWLVTKQKTNMAPRTRNMYLQAVSQFCKWAVESGRLNSNPLVRIKGSDQSNKKRTRRALSEKELHRLLYVARWRPIAEYGRTTEPKIGDELPAEPKSRKTWALQPLSFGSMPEAVERARTKLADNPTFLEELDRRGQERELIYKVAVLTGLRRGEIESLTVGHFHLSGALPFIRMRPQDTKNREAVDVPLQAQLADDLRQWLELKRRAAVGVVSLQIHKQGLKPTERLFDVPRQLVKTLDRDLAVAGIPVAVHCTRMVERG